MAHKPILRTGAAASNAPIRFVLLIGGALIVVCGVVWAWRTHGVDSRIVAAIPPRPTLKTPHAILASSLAAAEVQAKSPSVQGVVELGRIYHANGFASQAEACWEFLRREDLKDGRWTYYLADVRRLQSDYPAMAVLLRETLERAPDYLAARVKLANHQFKLGQFDAAERNYRLALATAPKDPHSNLGLVRLALYRDRKHDAKLLLEQVLNDAPHFSTAHNLYAELRAAAGDAAAAAKHRWLGRETLRYREPEDPWLAELQEWCFDYERLCVLGTIEFQTENFDKALSFFQRAIRIRPEKPQAYELLSNVHLKREDPGKARDAIEQALTIVAAKSPGLFVALSSAYRASGKPMEAERAAQFGIAQLGQVPELLDARALALAGSEKHEEAVDVWRTALELNPNNPHFNYNAAKSYLALRQLDSALEALDRSLTLEPHFLPTLLLRGEIELDARHLDLAAKYLEPAFESHPENAEARRLLSQWHLQMAEAAESKTDFTNAERHLRDGLKISPRHPELLVRLGLLCLLRGRPADAIAPLAVFHELRPESAPGCLFLGRAYAESNQRERAVALLTKGAQLAERSGSRKTAAECRSLLQRL